jgi:glucose-1-phosphate adenylyltransferase
LLASTGIYLFRLAGLQEVLGEDAQRQSTHDLVRAILPGIIGWYWVAAFPFVEGIGSATAYWRDEGTIDAYWEAYIDLVDPQADFQLSQSQEPLRAASA